MGFNRFVYIIIIRSVSLALNALLIAFFAIKTNWISTFIFFCVIFVIQIILLIRFTSRVNRDLAHFLIYLKEENTSLYFNKKRIDRLFRNLDSEINKINEAYREIQKEKIKKQNFLDLLLERVGTGILVINCKNEIKLYNQALLNLFGLEKETPTSEIKLQVNFLIKDCKEINADNQKIINVNVNHITRRVLINKTEIKEENEVFSIYSFHDIDREITDYELQSWYGLIKVLSHEIINTLTPMSTTVNTLKDCLTINGDVKNISELSLKDLHDAVIGVKLLENRIIGLQNFINKFRQLSDIPVPELMNVSVYELTKDLPIIFKENKKIIQVDSSTRSMIVPADKDLMELVFINLIKNAIEAHANKIIITSLKNDNQNIVIIKDDGNGIEKRIRKKIFLPFYTTKDNGSGIGLSLARQIMFAHDGNIEINSDTQGTIIKLYFVRKVHK